MQYSIKETANITRDKTIQCFRDMESSLPNFYKFAETYNAQKSPSSKCVRNTRGTGDEVGYENINLVVTSGKCDALEEDGTFHYEINPLIRRNNPTKRKMPSCSERDKSTMHRKSITKERLHEMIRSYVDKYCFGEDNRLEDKSNTGMKCNVTSVAVQLDDEDEYTMNTKSNRKKLKRKQVTFNELQVQVPRNESMYTPGATVYDTKFDIKTKNKSKVSKQRHAVDDTRFKDDSGVTKSSFKNDSSDSNNLRYERILVKGKDKIPLPAFDDVRFEGVKYLHVDDDVSHERWTYQDDKTDRETVSKAGENTAKEDRILSHDAKVDDNILSHNVKVEDSVATIIDNNNGAIMHTKDEIFEDNIVNNTKTFHDECILSYDDLPCEGDERILPDGSIRSDAGERSLSYANMLSDAGEHNFTYDNIPSDAGERIFSCKNIPNDVGERMLSYDSMPNDGERTLSYDNMRCDGERILPYDSMSNDGERSLLCDSMLCDTIICKVYEQQNIKDRNLMRLKEQLIKELKQRLNIHVKREEDSKDEINIQEELELEIHEENEYENHCERNIKETMDDEMGYENEDSMAIYDDEDNIYENTLKTDWKESEENYKGEILTSNEGNAQAELAANNDVIYTPCEIDETCVTDNKGATIAITPVHSLPKNDVIPPLQIHANDTSEAIEEEEDIEMEVGEGVNGICDQLKSCELRAHSHGVKTTNVTSNETRTENVDTSKDLFESNATSAETSGDKPEFNTILEETFRDVPEVNTTSAETSGDKSKHSIVSNVRIGVGKANANELNITVKITNASKSKTRDMMNTEAEHKIKHRSMDFNPLTRTSSEGICALPVKEDSNTVVGNEKNAANTHGNLISEEISLLASQLISELGTIAGGTTVKCLDGNVCIDADVSKKHSRVTSGTSEQRLDRLLHELVLEEMCKYTESGESSSYGHEQITHLIEKLKSSAQLGMELCQKTYADIKTDTDLEIEDKLCLKYRHTPAKRCKFDEEDGHVDYTDAEKLAAYQMELEEAYLEIELALGNVIRDLWSMRKPSCLLDSCRSMLGKMEINSNVNHSENADLASYLAPVRRWLNTRGR